MPSKKREGSRRRKAGATTSSTAQKKQRTTLASTLASPSAPATPVSPIKRNVNPVLTTADSIIDSKRSVPCICGACLINCADNYVIPFPPNTKGRLKMLEMFSLRSTHTDESFWRLMDTPDIRVTLLHFSSEQLQLQNLGGLPIHPLSVLFCCSPLSLFLCTCLLMRVRVFVYA